MNGTRRFYLLGALLAGLVLLAILLPSATGEAQSTGWTPARIDLGDSGFIRIVDLDTDTGATGSSSVDVHAAEPEMATHTGAGAMNGQMDSSTTQSIQPASHVGGGWITIFSDDFEGAFPGVDWYVADGDEDTNGEYLWGKRDCRPYEGNHSTWAVGGGADGSELPCGSDYPDNADSVMIYGPFSLEDATQAELRFMYWLNTEPENDRLWVGASTGGDFYGAYTYGPTDWTERVFDLTDVPGLGDLTGEDLVGVAIGFVSDESTTLAEGAFVDDVVLRKYVEGPTVYLPLVVRSFPVTPEAPVLDAISNPDGVGDYKVSWSSSVGASTYTLQEATNADFSDATTAYSGSNTSTANSGRAVGTYYYRVQASNPYASSDWSNVESVKVTVPPPECPRTGEWFGTNDQGHGVWFVVEDSPRCQIAEDSLRIRFFDSCGRLVRLGFPGSYAITDNRFATGGPYEDEYTWLKGEFTSYTTASGTFNYWGVNPGGYPHYCTASGTWYAPTDAANDYVYALAVQPDGKILVGGAFSSLREPRSKIARLNPDGTLDEDFNPGGIDNLVWTLAVQPDDKILVGGTFTEIGGQPRAGIARLNPDGTLDEAFNPGAHDWVKALSVQPDGKIVVAGEFTQLGGEPRENIGRLHPDGSLDTDFNPGADAGIRALTVQADQKIVVGGNFTELGGESRRGIGRLNPDGSLDGAFDPGGARVSWVSALEMQTDGKILVGGAFSDMGGQPRDSIARLNPDGTADATLDPGASLEVHVLAVQADHKILVGANRLAGEDINRIGRLNPDGTLDAAFSGWANNNVRALAVQADGKIVLGGWFTKLCGELRPFVGRLNADGTLDTSFP